MPTPLRIDVLTIFPELFEPVLGNSVTGRARDAGIVEWFVTDIRRHTENKQGKVDDRPFGGGPGMVGMCQPLWDAAMDVEAQDQRPATRVLMTPQGERLTQRTVEELARSPRLLVIAGHYEGVDERVIERLAPREISVGDYVLTGGDLPAMMLIDAITRLLPGVLGHEAAAREDSFTLKDDRGRRLLDCPHYTRPREWQGMEAPEILFSGDHAKVEAWRQEKRIERTRARRPDLLEDDDDEKTAPH